MSGEMTGQLSGGAMTAIAIAHAAATSMMAGLIWFVQVVHYPLFAGVGRDHFNAYEREHTRRTTLVVGPLMLVEAATAALLVVLLPAGEGRGLALVGGGLLAAVWLSTFFVQVPCHDRLGRGFDEPTWRRLVATNRLRTLLWSARAGIALWLLVLVARSTVPEVSP